MKKIIVQIYLFLLFTCFILQQGLSQSCNNFSTDNLVIQFNAGMSPNDVNTLLNTYGGTIIDAILDYNLNIYLVDFNVAANPNFNSIEEVHEFFDCGGGIEEQGQSKPRIKSVDFDYKITPIYDKDGHAYRSGGNYNLGNYTISPNCSVLPNNAFCFSNPINKIKIAVVDAGHQWGSPFDHLITQNGAYDFVDNDYFPNDVTQYKHGTGVNSVIAGILGEHSANISIVCIKILNAESEADLFTFYKGAVHAIKINANIVNFSVGALFCKSDICNNIFDAILRVAESKNILVSAAAGNDFANIDNYLHIPSSSSNNNMIVTGSATCKNRKSDFSNFGHRNVDLFTLGEDIQVYPAALASGTSYAAPQITAIAALKGIAMPSFNYSKVKKAVLEATTNYNLPCQTRGILNWRKALNCTSSDQIGIGRFSKNATQMTSHLIDGINKSNQATLNAYFSDSNTLSLSITSSFPQSGQIRLISLSGQSIIDAEILLIKGNNFEELQRIDNIPMGLYLVQVTMGEKVLTQKCFKMY